MRCIQYLVVCIGLIILTVYVELRCAAPAVSSPISVDVPSFGVVKGLQYTVEGAKVDAFLGIPFAEPPTGPLRFRPPVKLNKVSGLNRTIDATRLPNTCFQTVDSSFDNKYVDTWNPNTNMSEDCLYLNVWRPATSANNRTVMVWIYGGGFSSGSSTLDLYDGKFFSLKGDVILVSMQYRVGPLGFLALGSSQTGGASGNAGLLDQQMALGWIRDNIASFGGDPGRVTLFGESAGSASVSYHLLSPGSAELFRSAILMSASVSSDWNFMSRFEAVKSARALSKLLRCNVSLSDKDMVDCLRKVNADVLTEKQWLVASVGPAITSAFHPTIDGQFISKAPAELLRTGNFQKKDILVGNVLNEGSYFLTYLFPRLFPVTKSKIELSEDVYRSAIRNMSVLKASNDFVVNPVAFEYARPCGGYDGTGWTSDYTAALDQLLGDAIFVCPVVNLARNYATNGSRSVYVYSFNHRTSGNPWPTWTGAAHGYEIDHVFGIPWRPENRSIYTDEERALSNVVIAYWTNFAKTGDPNQGNEAGTSTPQQLPVWPKYTINNRTVLVLDTGSKLTTQIGHRERECDYWFNIVPLLEAAAAGSQLRTIGLLWTVLACLLARFCCH